MSTPISSPGPAPKSPTGPKSGGSQTNVNMIHDLQHQVGLVREALRSEKRRLGFFLGAGCPLGIYDKDEAKSIKHIPDVAGLTSAIESKLAGEKDLLECWHKLTTACKSDKCKVPNVEHILTQLRTICALKGASTVDGMSVENLRKLDTKTCEIIVELVNKSLPEYTNAYQRFALWVRQLERTYPLEVFTPNYDLLVTSLNRRPWKSSSTPAPFTNTTEFRRTYLIPSCKLARKGPTSTRTSKIVMERRNCSFLRISLG